MDRARRRKVGVPREVTFKTKSAIALEQLRWACAAGLPHGVVLMDAGYGTDTNLRTDITALGLSYVAGIQPQTSVWAPGTGPQRPKTWSGYGRPPKLLRRDSKHYPISVKKLALGLPSQAWRKITWREGGGHDRPIVLVIEGNGFLRHMVRNIVGTLVEVGVGRWPPAMVPQILGSRDRTKAGPTAPAQGLFLVRVKYGPEL